MAADDVFIFSVVCARIEFFFVPHLSTTGSLWKYLSHWRTRLFRLLIRSVSFCLLFYCHFFAEIHCFFSGKGRKSILVATTAPRSGYFGWNEAHKKKRTAVCGSSIRALLSITTCFIAEVRFLARWSQYVCPSRSMSGRITNLNVGHRDPFTSPRVNCLKC